VRHCRRVGGWTCRSMTRRRRIGIVVAVVLGSLLLYEIASSFVAYTADAYVQSDLVAVAPEVSGRIIAVAVNDNQTVAEGDLLVTIDPISIQLIADQHRAEVEEARARVTADQDEVASARAAHTAAISAATYAHETRTRLSVLATANDASRADLQKGRTLRARPTRRSRQGRPRLLRCSHDFGTPGGAGTEVRADSHPSAYGA
jgi:multidrug efflux system membrane fusion protein